MHVSLLTDTFAWGGTEVATVMLANDLAARGHQVTIVEMGPAYYRDARFEHPESIRVISVAMPKRYRSWAGLLRALLPLERDVAVFVKPSFWAGSWRFDCFCRLLFKAYLTIEQLTCEPMLPKSIGKHFFGLVPGIGLWWYRLLWARHLRSWGPQKVVCVSDAGRRTLIKECAFPARKLVVAPNGADPTIYRPDDGHRSRVRQAWGVSAGTLVFGSIGRLSGIKGFDLALKAFQKLTEQMPERDLRLVLVGRGDEEEALRGLAARLGIADKVLFPGFCERPWEVHPALDVFVLPSRNEGLPLALCEAMACGRPVIASDVGGASEVISDSTLGWIVRPGNPEALLGAMKAAAFLSDEERAVLGERAKEHVRRHFNLRNQGSTIANLLESLAGMGRRPVPDASMTLFKETGA
jgi:glycosyltransferase involved in cell wall biosynthesis